MFKENNFFGYSHSSNQLDSDDDDHVNFSTYRHLLSSQFFDFLPSWPIRFLTADEIFF